MRIIAPSMPSHACPGSAAGGPRRDFVPQATAVQTCASPGAPAATYGHRLKLAERIILPLYR